MSVRNIEQEDESLLRILEIFERAGLAELANVITRTRMVVLRLARAADRETFIERRYADLQLLRFMQKRNGEIFDLLGISNSKLDELEEEVDSAIQILQSFRKK